PARHPRPCALWPACAAAARSRLVAALLVRGHALAPHRHTAARGSDRTAAIIRPMQRRHAAAAALLIATPAWATTTKHRRAPSHQPARSGDGPYGRRRDVLEAAQALALDHGLDSEWVEGALAQARFVRSVAQLIMPNATAAAKNWAAYRA